MNMTDIALVGVIGWTLILLLGLEVYRTLLVVKAGRAANSFSPQGDDTTPFGHRLTRAHANCYESFVLLGGCLLYALATGNTHITDGLAGYLLLSRIAQSVVHLISTSILASQIRFLLFSIQLVICGYWLISFCAR